MKKAIVTGATGFIGKFLVRELVKQNVEVIAVVRRGTKNLNTINALPVKIVECNIADYHMLPDMIADRDIDVQKKGIGYCISFYSPAGIPFRIKRKIKYIYSKVTRK